MYMFKNFMLSFGCLMIMAGLTITMGPLGLFIGVFIIYIVFKDK